MIKLYKKYLSQYKKEVFLGPLFKLVEAIFELIVPIIVAFIIDKGIELKDKVYVYKMGLVLIALAILGLLSTLVCQYYASKASMGVGTKLRNDIYVHVSNLEPSKLDKFKQGYLITLISNDTNQIQVSVAMLIRLVVRAPFLIIGSTIMAFYINYKIASIFVVTTILIFLIIYIIMKISVKYNLKAQKNVDSLAKITKENITGIRVIKSLNNQEFEKHRFDNGNNNLNSLLMKVGSINAYLNPLVFLVINMALILIVWFGAKGVNVGALTKGEVISLSSYMTQIFLAIAVVARLVGIFTKAQASCRRVNEFLEIENDKLIVEIPYKDSEYLLEFSNVSLSYKDLNNNILNNLNFTLNKNETVGIIGGTGSGKTSIVNLINHLYKPTTGSIFLDGTNLNLIDDVTIHNKIGLAMQKPILLSGTIRDNLKIHCPLASDEQLFEALKISQATFITNLDDLVYEGGKNFSGGERQRLSIARALVGKPEILILDDTLNALDLKTEKQLRQALSNNFNGTLIIVGQKINSIKHANKIIVLDKGRIVGIGCHEELYNNCSIYKEICLSQEILVGGDNNGL